MTHSLKTVKYRESSKQTEQHPAVHASLSQDVWEKALGQGSPVISRRVPYSPRLVPSTHHVLSEPDFHLPVGALLRSTHLRPPPPCSQTRCWQLHTPDAKQLKMEARGERPKGPALSQSDGFLFRSPFVLRLPSCWQRPNWKRMRVINTFCFWTGCSFCRQGAREKKNNTHTLKKPHLAQRHAPPPSSHPLPLSIALCCQRIKAEPNSQVWNPQPLWNRWDTIREMEWKVMRQPLLCESAEQQSGIEGEVQYPNKVNKQRYFQTGKKH